MSDNRTNRRRSESVNERGHVVGEYTLIRTLGSGSFARVYEAYHNVTNEKVAVKAIRLSKLNRKLQKNLESEIAIMQNFQHPNIVRLLGLHKNDTHMYLIMELCTGGDLHSFIRKNETVSEKMIRILMTQLKSGLKFLWSNNLVHRDLKPQNLLLSTDPEVSSAPQLKIADFGFARHLAVSSMAETLCGSPLYMAPEILRLRKYDAKADLWSVGTILYEMLCGRTPFTGRNQIQLLQNIETKDFEIPNDKHVSPDAVHLLNGLLQRNPLLRMTFEEFFSHPYMTKGGGGDDDDDDDDLTKTSQPSTKCNNVAPLSVTTSTTAATYQSSADPPTTPESVHRSTTWTESTPTEREVNDSTEYVIVPPSPLTVIHTTKGDVVSSAQSSRQIAKAVAVLASEMLRQNAPASLRLYVRALDILYDAIVSVRNAASPSNTVREVRRHLAMDFKCTLRMVRQCRVQVSGDEDTDCVEVYLWFGALGKCRAAAAQELVGLISESHREYKLAALLLIALERSIVRHSSRGDDDQDLHEIRALKATLTERITKTKREGNDG